MALDTNRQRARELTIELAMQLKTQLVLDLHTTYMTTTAMCSARPFPPLSLSMLPYRMMLLLALYLCYVIAVVRNLNTCFYFENPENPKARDLKT